MYSNSHSTKKLNYGIDAPTVVRNMAIAGASLGLAGVVLYWLLWSSQPALAIVCINIGLWSCFWLLLVCGVMLWGSKVGKFQERDSLLSGIPWRGDEQVLDV